MASSAQIIGVVKAIQGEVIIKSEDGSLRVAKVGDEILSTDVLDTSNGSLEMGPPPKPTVAEADVTDETVATTEKPPEQRKTLAEEDAEKEKVAKSDEDDVKKAIEDIENLESTAAGNLLSQGNTTYISVRSGVKALGKIGDEVLGADGKAVGTDAYGSIDLGKKEHAILETLKSGGIGLFDPAGLGAGGIGLGRGGLGGGDSLYARLKNARDKIIDDAQDDDTGGDGVIPGDDDDGGNKPPKGGDDDGPGDDDGGDDDDSGKIPTIHVNEFVGGVLEGAGYSGQPGASEFDVLSQNKYAIKIDGSSAMAALKGDASGAYAFLQSDEFTELKAILNQLAEDVAKGTKTPQEVGASLDGKIEYLEMAMLSQDVDAAVKGLLEKFQGLELPEPKDGADALTAEELQGALESAGILPEGVSLVDFMKQGAGLSGESQPLTIEQIAFQKVMVELGFAGNVKVGELDEMGLPEHVNPDMFANLNTEDLITNLQGLYDKYEDATPYPDPSPDTYTYHDVIESLETAKQDIGYVDEKGIVEDAIDKLTALIKPVASEQLENASSDAKEKLKELLEKVDGLDKDMSLAELKITVEEIITNLPADYPARDAVIESLSNISSELDIDALMKAERTEAVVSDAIESIVTAMEYNGLNAAVDKMPQGYTEEEISNLLDQNISFNFNELNALIESLVGPEQGAVDSAKASMKEILSEWVSLHNDGTPQELVDSVNEKMTTFIIKAEGLQGGGDLVAVVNNLKSMSTDALDVSALSAEDVADIVHENNGNFVSSSSLSSFEALVNLLVTDEQKQEMATDQAEWNRLLSEGKTDELLDKVSADLDGFLSESDTGRINFAETIEDLKGDLEALQLKATEVEWILGRDVERLKYETSEVNLETVLASRSVLTEIQTALGNQDYQSVLDDISNPTKKNLILSGVHPGYDDGDEMSQWNVVNKYLDSVERFANELIAIEQSVVNDINSLESQVTVLTSSNPQSDENKAISETIAEWKKFAEDGNLAIIGGGNDLLMSVSLDGDAFISNSEKSAKTEYFKALNKMNELSDADDKLEQYEDRAAVEDLIAKLSSIDSGNTPSEIKSILDEVISSLKDIDSVPLRYEMIDALEDIRDNGLDVGELVAGDISDAINDAIADIESDASDLLGTMSITVPADVELYMLPGMGFANEDFYTAHYPEGSTQPLLDSEAYTGVKASVDNLVKDAIRLSSTEEGAADAIKAAIQDVIDKKNEDYKDLTGEFLDGIPAPAGLDADDKRAFIGTVDFAEAKAEISQNATLDSIKSLFGMFKSESGSGTENEKTLTDFVRYKSNLAAFPHLNGDRPPGENISDEDYKEVYLPEYKTVDSQIRVLIDLGLVSEVEKVGTEGRIQKYMSFDDGAMDQFNSMSEEDFNELMQGLSQQYQSQANEIQAEINALDILLEKLQFAANEGDAEDMIQELQGIDEAFEAGAKATMVNELITTHLGEGYADRDSLLETLTTGTQAEIDAALKGLGDAGDKFAEAFKLSGNVTYEIDQGKVAEARAKVEEDLVEIQKEIPALEKVMQNSDFVSIQEMLAESPVNTSKVEKAIIELKGSVERYINSELTTKDTQDEREINIEFYRDLTELQDVFNDQSNLTVRLQKAMNDLIEEQQDDLEKLQTAEKALKASLDDNSFILYSESSSDFTYQIDVSGDKNIYDANGQVVGTFPQTGNVIVDVVADGIQVDSDNPIDGVLKVTVDHNLVTDAIDPNTGKLDTSKDTVTVTLELDAKALDPTEGFNGTIQLPPSFSAMLAEMDDTSQVLANNDKGATWSLKDDGKGSFFIQMAEIPADDSLSNLDLNDIVSLTFPRNGEGGFLDRVGDSVSFDLNLDAYDVDLDTGERTTVDAADVSKSQQTFNDAIMVKSLVEGESGKSDEELVDDRQIGLVNVSEALGALVAKFEFFKEVFLEGDEVDQDGYDKAVSLLFSNSSIDVTLDVPKGQSAKLVTMVPGVEFEQNSDGSYSLRGDALYQFAKQADYEINDKGEIVWDPDANLSFGVGPAQEHSSQDFTITTQFTVENHNNNEPVTIGEPNTLVAVDAIAEGVEFESESQILESGKADISEVAATSDKVSYTVSTSFEFGEQPQGAADYKDYTVKYDITELYNKALDAHVAGGGAAETFDFSSQIKASWNNEYFNENSQFVVDTSVPGKVSLVAKITNVEAFEKYVADNISSGNEAAASMAKTFEEAERLDIEEERNELLESLTPEGQTLDSAAKEELVAQIESNVEAYQQLNDLYDVRVENAFNQSLSVKTFDTAHEQVMALEEIRNPSRGQEGNKTSFFERELDRLEELENSEPALTREAKDSMVNELAEKIPTLEEMTQLLMGKYHHDNPRMTSDEIEEMVLDSFELSDYKSLVAKMESMASTDDFKSLMKDDVVKEVASDLSAKAMFDSIVDSQMVIEGDMVTGSTTSFERGAESLQSLLNQMDALQAEVIAGDKSQEDLSAFQSQVNALTAELMSGMPSKAKFLELADKAGIDNPEVELGYGSEPAPSGTYASLVQLIASSHEDVQQLKYEEAQVQAKIDAIDAQIAAGNKSPDEVTDLNRDKAELVEEKAAFEDKIQAKIEDVAEDIELSTLSGLDAAIDNLDDIRIKGSNIDTDFGELTDSGDMLSELGVSSDVGLNIVTAEMTADKIIDDMFVEAFNDQDPTPSFEANEAGEKARQEAIKAFREDPANQLDMDEVLDVYKNMLSGEAASSITPTPFDDILSSSDPYVVKLQQMAANNLEGDKLEAAKEALAKELLSDFESDPGYDDALASLKESITYEHLMVMEVERIDEEASQYRDLNEAVEEYDLAQVMEGASSTIAGGGIESIQAMLKTELANEAEAKADLIAAKANYDKVVAEVVGYDARLEMLETQLEQATEAANAIDKTSADVQSLFEGNLSAFQTKLKEAKDSLEIREELLNITKDQKVPQITAEISSLDSDKTAKEAEIKTATDEKAALESQLLNLQINLQNTKIAMLASPGGALATLISDIDSSINSKSNEIDAKLREIDALNDEKTAIEANIAEKQAERAQENIFIYNNIDDKNSAEATSLKASIKKDNPNLSDADITQSQHVIATDQANVDAMEAAYDAKIALDEATKALTDHQNLKDTLDSDLAKAQTDYLTAATALDDSQDKVEALEKALGNADNVASNQEFDGKINIELSGDAAAAAAGDSDQSSLKGDLNVTSKEVNYTFDAGAVLGDNGRVDIAGGPEGFKYEMSVSFSAQDTTGSENFNVFVDITELAQIEGFDASSMLGIRFVNPQFEGTTWEMVSTTVNGEPKVFMKAVVENLSGDFSSQVEVAVNSDGLDVLRSEGITGFNTAVGVNSFENIPEGDAEFSSGDNQWVGEHLETMIMSDDIEISGIPINTYFSNERQHDADVVTETMNEGFVFNLADAIGTFTPGADGEPSSVNINGVVLDANNPSQYFTETTFNNGVYDPDNQANNNGVNPIEAKLAELMDTSTYSEEDYEGLSLKIVVSKPDDSNLTGIDFSVNNQDDYFNSDNATHVDFDGDEAVIELTGELLYEYLRDPTNLTILTPQHESGAYTINNVDIQYTVGDTTYSNKPFVSEVNVESVADSSGMSQDGVQLENLVLQTGGGDRAGIRLDVNASFADKDNSEHQTVLVELPDSIGGKSSRNGMGWEIKNADDILKATGATVEIKVIEGKEYAVFSNVKDGVLDATLDLGFDSDVIAKIGAGEFTPEFNVMATTSEKVFDRADGSNDSLKTVYRETTALDVPGFEPSVNISELQADFVNGFNLDLQDYIDAFDGTFRDDANLTFGVAGNTNVKYIAPNGEELRVNPETGMVNLVDEQLQKMVEEGNGFVIKVVPDEFSGKDLTVDIKAARGDDAVPKGEGTQEVGPTGFKLDIVDFIASLGGTAGSATVTISLSGEDGKDNAKIYDVAGREIIGIPNPTTGKIDYTLDSTSIADYINADPDAQNIIIQPGTYDSNDFRLEVTATDAGNSMTLYPEMDVKVDAVASGIDESRESSANAAFKFNAKQVENPYDKAQLHQEADDAQQKADAAKAKYETQLEAYGEDSDTVRESKAAWEKLNEEASEAASRAEGGSERQIDVMGDMGIEVNLDIKLADMFDASEQKWVVVDFSEFLDTVPDEYQDEILGGLTKDSFGTIEGIAMSGGRWEFELNTQGTPETNPDYGERTGRIIMKVDDDFKGDEIKGTLLINGIDPYKAFGDINEGVPSFEVKVSVESEERSYKIDLNDHEADNTELGAESIKDEAYKAGEGEIYDALVAADEAQAAYEKRLEALGPDSDSVKAFKATWDELESAANALVAKEVNADIIKGDLTVSPTVIEVKENQGLTQGGPEQGIFSIDINAQLLHIREAIKEPNGLGNEAKFKDAKLEIVIGGPPNFKFLDQYGIDGDSLELEEIKSDGAVVGYKMIITGDNLQNLYDIWSSEIESNINKNPTYDVDSHEFAIQGRTETGNDLDYPIQVNATKNGADINGFKGEQHLILVSPGASPLQADDIIVESEIRYVSGNLTGGDDKTLTDEIALNVNFKSLGIQDITGEDQEIVITFDGLDGFVEQEGSFNDVRLDGKNVELWDLRKNDEGKLEAVFTGKITSSVLENPGFLDINLIMERDALKSSLTGGANIGYDVTINSTDVGTQEYLIGDVADVDTSSVSKEGNVVHFNKFTVVDENQSAGYTDPASMFEHDLSTMFKALHTDITNFLKSGGDMGKNLDDYFSEKSPTLDVNLVGAEKGATIYIGETKIMKSDTGQHLETTSSDSETVTLDTETLQKLYELWEHEQQSLEAGNEPIQRINLDLQDFVDKLGGGDSDAQALGNAAMDVQMQGDMMDFKVYSVGGGEVEGALKMHLRDGPLDPPNNQEGTRTLQSYEVEKTVDKNGLAMYEVKSTYYVGDVAAQSDNNGTKTQQVIKYYQKTDGDGNAVLTSDGDPIFLMVKQVVERDASGKYVAKVDGDGNPVYEELGAGAVEYEGVEGIPGLFTEWSMPSTALQNYLNNEDPEANVITVVPPNPEALDEPVPILITGTVGGNNPKQIGIYPSSLDPEANQVNYIDNIPTLEGELPTAVNVSDLAASASVLRVEPAEGSNSPFVFSVDLNGGDGEIPYEGDEEYYVHVNPAVDGADLATSGLQVKIPEETDDQKPYGEVSDAMAYMDLNISLDFTGDDADQPLAHRVVINLQEGVQFTFNPATDVLDADGNPSKSVWSYDAQKNQLVLENALGENSNLTGEHFQETIRLSYNKANMAEQLALTDVEGQYDGNYVSPSNVLQPNFTMRVSNIENEGIIGAEAKNIQDFSTFTKGAAPTFIESGQFANDSFGIYTVNQSDSTPELSEIVKVDLEPVYQKMAALLGWAMDGSTPVDEGTVAATFPGGSSGDVIQVDFTPIAYKKLEVDDEAKTFKIGDDSTRPFEGSVNDLGTADDIQENFVKWYQNLTRVEDEKHTDVKTAFFIESEPYRDQDFEFNVSVNAKGNHLDDGGDTVFGAYNTKIEDYTRTQVVVNMGAEPDLGEFGYKITQPKFDVDQQDMRNMEANGTFHEPPASFEFTIDDTIFERLMNVKDSQVVIDFPNLDFAGNGYDSSFGLGAAIEPGSPWSINYAGKLVWTKPEGLPTNLTDSDLADLREALDPALTSVTVLVPSSVALDSGLDPNVDKLTPEISYGYKPSGMDDLGTDDKIRWNDEVTEARVGGDTDWVNPFTHGTDAIEVDHLIDQDRSHQYKGDLNTYLKYNENLKYASNEPGKEGLFIETDNSSSSEDWLNLTYNHAGFVAAYEDMVKKVQAYNYQVEHEFKPKGRVTHSNWDNSWSICSTWEAWRDEKNRLEAIKNEAIKFYNEFEPTGKDALQASGSDVIYAGSTNEGDTAESYRDHAGTRLDLDVINTGAGEDIIYGGDGNDIAYGGRDSDAIYGGKGIDWIDGQQGDDTLVAGDWDWGNRQVSDGFSGINYMEEGKIKIDWAHGKQSQIVNGEVENEIDLETAMIRGAEMGGDVIVAGPGNDHIFGQANNTLIDIEGAGAKTLEYTAEDVFSADKGGDALNAFDVVLGMDNDDTIDLAGIFNKLEETMGKLSAEQRMSMVHTKSIEVNHLEVDDDSRTVSQDDNKVDSAQAVYIQAGAEIYHIAAVVDWQGGNLLDENIDVGDTNM